jgi:ribonuclease D
MAESTPPKSEVFSGLPEHYVSRPDELAAACAHIAQFPVFGFDTEFIGEESYYPDLCLVQVATPERLYLLDPLSVGSLKAFWELVADPQRVCVVHAAREEIRLCEHACGKPPGNLFDLQLAAGLVTPIYPLGHGALVQKVMGIQLSKGETLTEWRQRPLTRQQIFYAFDDVRYLLRIYERIVKRLDKLGRMGWAQEEFTALTTRALQDDPTIERWRKLRGLGALDRKRLAIVQELFNWRDAEAARINRPARVILRDDLLVDVARRNPLREKDLHVVRGLPRHELPGIMAAVERARNLPREHWPSAIERDNDPPQVTLLTNLLSVVLANICAKEQVAASLVASNHDLKLLVRDRLDGRSITDTPVRRGWRSEYLLPKLQAVLDGRTQLRVTTLKSEAPLELVDNSAADAHNR